MSGRTIRERFVYLTIGNRRYKLIETLIDITPPTYFCALCGRPAFVSSIHGTSQSNGCTIDLTTMPDNNDVIDLTNDDNAGTDRTNPPGEQVGQQQPKENDDASSTSSDESYSW